MRKLIAGIAAAPLVAGLALVALPAHAAPTLTATGGMTGTDVKLTIAGCDATATGGQRAVDADWAARPVTGGFLADSGSNLVFTATAVASEVTVDITCYYYDGTKSMATFTVGDGKIGGTLFVDTNGNGTQDPGEGPAVGATITLFDAQGNPLGKTATSDAQGMYSFDPMPAGTYYEKIVFADGVIKYYKNDIDALGVVTSAPVESIPTPPPAEDAGKPGLPKTGVAN